MAKRSGQWFGDSTLKTILAGAGVSQVIQLLPTANSLQSPRDIVIERIILSFQSRRILVADIEGFAFLVWKGDVLSGTTTPTESLDPLSTSTFNWAHASIMKYGVLKIPANTFDSTAQLPALSNEVTAETMEIIVKRKVNRANEGIFLAVAADLSSALKCNITWRAYYTYA